MSYGVRVYDDKGVDITGALTPVFFIESISASSGQRSYGTPPQGKSLKYLASSIFSQPANSSTPPTVNISSSDVTWSGLSRGNIIFYWG